MAGAYAMTNQVLNDGTKDSVLDRKQLKIYTADNYMMYASPNITDSFANFGIGKYSVEDGKVVETTFYGTREDATKDTFVLLVNKTPDGFRQVIEKIPIGPQNYKLTEDYQTAGPSSQSPLDGAWKQVKNIFVNRKGDSAINNNPMEYKVFQSGYFIWAITVKDSANRRTAVFGYGPFEMTGKDKMKETIANTTFISGLRGRTYEVGLEFPRPNMYKQTITFANGEKSIEIYEKLK